MKTPPMNTLSNRYAFYLYNFHLCLRNNVCCVFFVCFIYFVLILFDVACGLVCFYDKITINIT